MNEPILAGRYRLQGAVGGHADLFYAVDESLGRNVAVKRLPSDRRHWEQDIAQAAGLQDPHLLAIYDVVAEEDATYLITEELEGETLARWLRTQGRLAPDVMVRLLLQLTGAAVQAEQHGLREISIDPHYLLITPDGFLKVIAYGPLFGGHGYPDEPEQLAHKAGVLMYEMLTGLVYSDLAPLQQVAQDLHGALSQADVRHSWLPDRIEHIVHRALGLLAVGRYVTMQDLHRDLKTVNEALGYEEADIGARAAFGSNRPHVAATAVPAAPAAAQAEETSAFNRVKDSMDAMLESAQDGMKKVAQMRQVEFARSIARKLAEQSRPKRTLLPLVMVLALLLVLGGGSWWLFGEDKSMATGGMLGQVREVQMPSVLNKTQEQALQILTAHGFTVDSIRWEYKPTDSAGTAGKVYRQSVDPNAQVRIDQQVVLTVNQAAEQDGSGSDDNAGGTVDAPPGEVPNLRGLSRPEAEQLLLQLGYRYKYVIVPGDTPSGTVFRQDLEPGTEAKAGTRVIFSVSQ
ncbi:MAG TPA: PASTA domain-containing protein [Bacilli bacterium]|nr:PASTA domain-containing protein [Bacilli bacterium]